MGRGSCAVLWAALVGGLFGSGCDEAQSVDARACEVAAATIEDCFGPGSADAFQSSCGPQDAARVQGQQCLELTSLLLDEKADATWDPAVLDAIREALHDAIEQGLTVALQQVLERLGLSAANDYGAYLLLETTDSEQEAQTAAEQWARDLEGRPGFEPTVVAYPSGFGVAHAPCIMDLDSALPRLIADLVMSTPDTLEVLGGEVHQAEPTQAGQDLDVSLPVVLLPQRKDEAEHPLCE
jgi:hypothetical protein